MANARVVWVFCGSLPVSMEKLTMSIKSINSTTQRFKKKRFAVHLPLNRFFIVFSILNFITVEVIW